MVSLAPAGRLGSAIRVLLPFHSSFRRLWQPCDARINLLHFSRRLFGGLINDIKRKAPWYWSDFRDAFALQSIASVFFLYFACLAPIITFGGLLGEATGQNIVSPSTLSWRFCVAAPRLTIISSSISGQATMESLLTGAICGITYGLFSGQPLTILGSTGPVLVFETILFDFCK